MKKLNLLALVVLVSVNVFTPLSYAEETPDDPGIIHYDCNFNIGSESPYYLCELDSEGDYSCRASGNGYLCGQDGSEKTKRCELDDEDETSYRCSSTCDTDWTSGSEECPLTYQCQTGKYGYDCSEDGQYGNYYCISNGQSLEKSPTKGGGSYTCRDIWGAEYLNNCEEPELRGAAGYFCPYEKYSCVPENGGYLCTEGYGGEDYYFCKSTMTPKGPDRGSHGDYACYQPDLGKTFTNCEREGYGEYYCYVTYSCEIDKDGYVCIEDDEGAYTCKNYALLQSIKNGNLGNSYCYDNYDSSRRYEGCFKESNRYLCPVKRGTTIDVYDDYQCLPDNGRYVSKYDEDLGQCVYAVTGYDGKEIVIMSSNLGVTLQDPIGGYYQWGKSYGFQSYISDMTPDYNKYYELTDNEAALFESYDLSVLGDVWSSNENPCPTGFHVPSMSEWNNLFISWCENDEECDTRLLAKTEHPENGRTLSDSEWQGAYEDIVERFVEDYNLGLWGSRDESQINMFNMMGDYWSSERLLDGSDESYHYGGASNMSSWGLTIYPQSGVGPLGFFSNMATSVRCFKDVNDGESVATPVALDLYMGGCTEGEYQGGSAIRAVESSLFCNLEGHLGRKFVGLGEIIDVNDLYEETNLGNPGEGYEWVWYLDNNKNTKLTSNTFAQDTNLYVFKEEMPVVVTYTIEFDTDGGDAVAPIIRESDTTIVSEPQTKKQGYIFDGWYDGDNKVTFPYTVTGDKTLKAHWIESKPSGGNSGGYSGGGSTHKPESKGNGPSAENTPSSDNKKPQEPERSPATEDTTPQKEESSKRDISIDAYDNNYTEEFNRAYQFSSNNNITSASTIKNAKMYTPLTRIQMAKMLSQYAMNVLNQTPDPSRGMIKFRDVTNKMNEEYDDAVTLAYELGIMGINMPNNEFRPNDIVTRGEFVTALSRMVYGTSDGIYKQTSKYYTLHIQKLEQEKVLTKVDPTMIELRGYVMIMLMRLAPDL